ncbi:Pyrimidine dimer DNA glycosylase /DNA-(apurinic or apyrimidinic site) lyase [Mesorhizobium albiziae]|uniref:Pyrimidine dimer DNA glycosylase /DNA-(Apurinic or apyrimidinic site) lyase n=1 Tax=Neomesorhizobium albiziae TaxID=335020 RepID=A0A1I4DWF2_9HYPH|nr:pyrimidine dimer DNA glycosylase/endonuclease V [Mesorhizobium albiziae]GLS32771.1 endonuclease [Mesorhizobium albiziae]SFK97353.1 Pyrimidine dimer DNA glycosylase /DNA-(apurinic or apyrimidinic site) lyase [Mesorhizobium albiziae]
MTRINCVPPSELSGPHLVAEYWELPRVFALARAAALRGESPADPCNPRFYTLGAGHIRFFYCRLGYLARRQASLVQEMLARGYRPAFVATAELMAGIPQEWCEDWEPPAVAIAANRARIAERLLQQQSRKPSKAQLRISAERSAL